MEEFKKLDELCIPDIRNTHYVRIDKVTGEQEPVVLEDFYNVVSSIKLVESVPEQIKSQFNIAKNIAVYSWYSYPFHQICEMKTYATVENALKHKLNRKEHADGLQKLLKKAIHLGLVNDAGFSHIKTTNSKSVDYSKQLIELIPQFRNSLSHGSNNLHPTSAHNLQICCDLINQLFTNKVN